MVMPMTMQLLKIIREKIGIKRGLNEPITRYRLARDLNLPTPSLDYYEEKGKNLPLALLCKLKNLSGLTWNQIGKIIEDEYGEKGE